MAIHDTKLGLINEALTEYLTVARHCIVTDKGNGGCFGFPAALLLLCCVDAVGAYHRTRAGYKVMVDGQLEEIHSNKPSTYFYILNAPIFGQMLTKKQIAEIYSHFRSMLAHGAAIKAGGFLAIGTHDDPPFVIGHDGKVTHLNLVPLFNLVGERVYRFLSDNGEAIENSVQAKAITSTGR